MRCRSCRSEHIQRIIELGRQPLANSLRRDLRDGEHQYPLTLCFCNNCSLVQLEETVPKEKLFSNYIWLTGTSKSTQKYAKLFFQNVKKISKIKKKDLILEIASNDGTFLKPFVRVGYNVLGIDPAKNISNIANKHGIKTINAFWDEHIASKVEKKHGKAKVIIARNVIPHVKDLHSVIQGIAMMLKKEGVGVIEFHSAVTILQELHYDSIYHEHLYYFTLHTLERLLEKNNLYTFHVDTSSISGGSYVVYFSKQLKVKTSAYQKYKALEKKSGVLELKKWEIFRERCLEHKARSLKFFKKNFPQTIIGFGASARSATYMNYCGISSMDIKVMIDNNVSKQGFLTPGSLVPILSLQEGLSYDPNLIFIFAWNFKEEIIKTCRHAGYKGEFVTAFPNTLSVICKRGATR